MQDGLYDNRPFSFSVYAPSRTVVVYALSEVWWWLLSHENAQEMANERLVGFIGLKIQAAEMKNKKCNCS